MRMFYHIKNLQSTKTAAGRIIPGYLFYHIKNLQSTKTLMLLCQFLAVLSH